jgi:anion-transporting  ArsA/GET3 family ATPase
MAGVSGLLARDLVVVTGKGGVGKSTVAAAFGLVAARRGLRTIVAEVSARDDVSRALGGEAGEHEEELLPGLHHISVDPQTAMEEYLVDQLPSRALADLLTSSRTFTYLTAATPGMRELLTIGKVWDLAQDERRTGERAYDLVVLDAPATGHGLAVLGAPRTFGEVALAGPIARQARTIDAMLTDPARTGVVAVARPEEMPVSEALDLERVLQAELGVAVELFVVNALLPDRFTDAEARTLAGAASGDAVRAALAAHERARSQRPELSRLRRLGRAPVATLPFLFDAVMSPNGLRTLANRLERVL